MNLDHIINTFLRQIPDAVSNAPNPFIALATEQARDALLKHFLGHDLKDDFIEHLAFILAILCRSGASPPGWPVYPPDTEKCPFEVAAELARKLKGGKSWN